MQWINTIAGRTYVLVAAVLSLPLVAIFSALYFLDGIHTETRKVALVDLPITKAITEITIAQLEQEIILERAVALGLQIHTSPKIATRFEINRDRFFDKNKKIEDEFVSAINKLRDLTAVHGDSDIGRQLADLLRILTTAEIQHNQLFAMGEQLLRSKELQDQDDVTNLTLRVEKMEDSLDLLLVGALRQIENFTEDSAVKIEVLEREALTFVLVISAISITLALIIGTIVSRSISGPFDRASREIEKLNDGDTNLTLKNRPSGLKEAVSLKAGIIGYRDRILRERELSNELEDKAKELEHSLSRQLEINTILKDFVGMAAHEFRTPLAIIDASAQRLGNSAERDEGMSEFPDRLKSIRNNVSRLSALIDGTLEAARVEADELTVDKTWISLSGLCQGVADHQNDLSGWARVIVDDDDGADIEVLYDHSMLERVINNLVSNAIKYGDSKHKVIMSAVVEGGDIVLSVTDRGPGIGHRDLQKVFDKYFRGQNSTGNAGTGLGLHTCQKLIELHNGRIWAERVEYPSGTRISFTLRDWRHRNLMAKQGQ